MAFTMGNGLYYVLNIIYVFLKLRNEYRSHKNLTFSSVKMHDKMAISAYILKIVENDPFLRLQMRAREDFNRHQLFPQISNT